jgi:hypothetical protein
MVDENRSGIRCVSVRHDEYISYVIHQTVFQNYRTYSFIVITLS